jgi:ribose transport system permease protein
MMSNETAGFYPAAARILRKYVILFVLLALVVLFSFITPYFFTVQNLTNVFVQQSYVIIAAVGLSFVMISGGMDLSIGWQMSLAGVTTAVLMKNVGLPIWLSLVLCGILGILLGLFNGALAVTLKVHPLIVTLGSMTVFQGLSYTVANQSVILNLPQQYKFIGQGYLFGVVPVSVIIMILVVSIASFVLNRTYFGRFMYAVGSNADASHLAGINVKRVKLLVFSICGFFVAIATTILFARAGSAAPATGPGTEFNCMTAAVLGGISFKGGEGKMWGLVTGVLILGILGNGMQLIGMNTYVQYIVKGMVLLIAVGFDTYQKASVHRMRKVI